MKKTGRLLFAIPIAFGIIPATAYVDIGLYPFADVCGPDIETYCQTADDIADCMFGNYTLLNESCGDAVWTWAGGHYGWQGSDWRTLNKTERHDYYRQQTGDIAGDDGTERETTRVKMMRGNSAGGRHRR